jgi:DNA-binding MarR family transcriptional regulator
MTQGLSGQRRGQGDRGSAVGLPTGPAAGVGPLEASIGYTLKLATTALRSAMDAALRPLDLTVPQYACLERLGQQPGSSNAELARATFVTRQSMNLVLRGLQDRGLVTRPASVEQGRARPTRLTSRGTRALADASAAVRQIEDRMLLPLNASARRRLLEDLRLCATAVASPARER